MRVGNIIGCRSLVSCDFGCSILKNFDSARLENESLGSVFSFPLRQVERLPLARVRFCVLCFVLSVFAVWCVMSVTIMKNPKKNTPPVSGSVVVLLRTPKQGV